MSGEMVRQRHMTDAIGVVRRHFDLFDDPAMMSIGLCELPGSVIGCVIARVPSLMLTVHSQLMKTLRCAGLLLTLLFAGSIQAESFALPSGLSLEPDSSLDLTYQVIPAYDETEKVVAGWSGDELLYFLTSEKLPSGWLDPSKYFAGLIRDLRDAGLAVDVGRRGEFEAQSGLGGTFMEITHSSAAQAPATIQVAHFLTDGKVAFIAFATLVEQTGADRMLKETTSLLGSAAISTASPPVPPAKSNEHPFFGVWQSNSAAPDGKPITTVLNLKDDLTFFVEVSTRDSRTFSAVGGWSVSNHRISWTYIRSNPTLPDDEKSSEEEIVSHSDDLLVLRSMATGMQREFVRK
jgi:hypothetical protein